jgi:tetratricopeptide (TPR) repeat protein
VSEAVYERYKDALRRGHVAGLRGRLDVALAAYVEAATIAPERALPHASIGAIYLRLERPADALVAFDAALQRASADEAALRGHADALAALGRRADAAEDLDRLSVVLEAAERLTDALDAACQALELAESRTRRRSVQRLVDLVAAVDSEAARAAVERGTRSLALGERPAGSEAGLADAVAPGSPFESPQPPAPPEPPPDPIVLIGRAAEALDRGDVTDARDGLISAGMWFARGGADDAALDACYQAVVLDPVDPTCHLALTDRYLERGWTGAAAEKLRLLGRLAMLADDPATFAQVRTIAQDRLAGEPGVRELLDR